MAKALGLVEYSTVSAGLRAADTIAKTAEVRLLRAQIICPGKYVLLFAGELGAIRAVLDAAQSKHEEHLLDSFLLGNPHEQLIRALEGEKNENASGAALGSIEVETVASAIVAADTAAKTAGVQILELRLEREVANKAYVLITGTVSEVAESVSHASRRAQEVGTFLDSAVLPNPDGKLWETLLQ